MTRRASLALAVLGSFLLSACAGLTINPPKPSGMPRADAPSPLKAGILMKRPRFEWQGMGGMNTAYMEAHRDRWMIKPMMAAADDAGGKFLRALQASGAFARVGEVKSLAFDGTGGEEDILIEADFSGKYTQDPAGMGKALMTGFLLLLPAPFVRYDDAFTASAELAVYDRTGRLIHKYSERRDVATSAALFSAGTPASITAGIDAVASNLAAALVSALIADREGFGRAAPAEPAVAARRSPPEPAAEPVPALPPEPAPSAAEPAARPEEIAEAKPDPKPAPRGPLSAAEEAEIDNQVMP